MPFSLLVNVKLCNRSAVGTLRARGKADGPIGSLSGPDDGNVIVNIGNTRLRCNCVLGPSIHIGLIIIVLVCVYRELLLPRKEVCSALGRLSRIGELYQDARGLFERRK